MPKNKQWKSVERRIAAKLGTRRTPLSGSNSGHDTNSDTLHPEYYVEAKYRKNVPLWDELEALEKSGKSDGLVPMIVLQKSGEGNPTLGVTRFDEAMSIIHGEATSLSVRGFFNTYMVQHVRSKRPPYFTLWNEVEENAKNEGKLPILVFCQHNKQKEVAVIRLW